MEHAPETGTSQPPTEHLPGNRGARYTGSKPKAVWAIKNCIKEERRIIIKEENSLAPRALSCSGASPDMKAWDSAAYPTVCTKEPNIPDNLSVMNPFKNRRRASRPQMVLPLPAPLEKRGSNYIGSRPQAAMASRIALLILAPGRCARSLSFPGDEHKEERTYPTVCIRNQTFQTIQTNCL